MFRSRSFHWLVGLGCLLAASMSVSAAVAQSSTLTVVQSSDNTLYLEQGSNAWSIVPNSISDSDLAALTPSGELDGVIPAALLGSPDAPALLQVVLGSDGMFYIAQGGTMWTLVPNRIGDADLAALTQIGEIDGTISVSTLAPPVAAPPAPATANPVPATTAPGTVLLSDDFTDEQQGSLRSGQVRNGFVKYLDGEYQMAQTQAGNPWPAAQIPGTYSDSSIAFDIRFVNPGPDVALTVGCRRQEGQAYFAQVEPQRRTASLLRLDANNATYLVPTTPQSALQPDSSNHIELRCVGTTISLLLNGTLADTATDSAYASGGLYITAGNSSDTSDARLAHLVVTQPLPSSTAVAAPPTSAPAPGVADAHPQIPHSSPRLAAISHRVSPHDTDPAIDDALQPHLASVATCDQPSGYLVVYLPGTGGLATGGDAVQVLNVATQDCLHGISLSYPDVTAAAIDCFHDPDPDCYEKWRLQKLDGVQRSPHLSTTPANSIENRLLKLLEFLARTYPSEGWNRYIDGNAVRWDHIVVAGLSQGGGMAAMIGHVHLTARVVMFASITDAVGPVTGPSPAWVAKPSMSTVSRS